MRSTLILAAFFCFTHTLSAQTNDTLPEFTLDAVEISASRIAFGRMDVPMRKEALSEVLERAGFSLVRRGVFFAQDIAADGFRRGDITVAVDGERYHSACPNRMDSPLTRVNPLDLAVVTLDKSAARAVSGLGGSVHFRRRRPETEWRLHASLSGSGDASRSIDAAGLLEGSRHALSMRYATGEPYLNGDGNDFGTLYGYAMLPNYTLAEGTVRGEHADWQYGGGFSYTENVVFPYLLMDERFNRVSNVHVQWKELRAYATYTDHLMSNAFRGSAMSMTTKARNLTAGLAGYGSELWLRRWDADNVFVLPSGMQLENHMLPEAMQYYAAHAYNLASGPITATLRAGFSYQSIGDELRLDFYREVHTAAENGRWFAVAALTAEWRTRLSSHSGYGIQVEAAAEPPQMEELYIAVRKPQPVPAWTGNPALSQPMRATLRSSGRLFGLQVELYGTAVRNYVFPVKKHGTNGMYQTFGNTDAWLAGATIGYTTSFVYADMAWTWGEQMESTVPLSEIPPLRGSVMLHTPAWKRFVLRGGITAHTAQRRVDPSLAESATPGWARVDLGLRWHSANVEVDFLIENLLDRNYRQHLSYLRNPFSAGRHVWDPGRIIRLQLHMVSPL